MSINAHPRSLVHSVVEAIRGRYVPLVDEKATQIAIADSLDEAGIYASREHRLDGAGIVDFFIDGLAIEVKLKYSALAVYRQLERYAGHQDVRALLLITLRSQGLPESIEGKPVYSLNLGMASL